jgi:hypothetical protein
MICEFAESKIFFAKSIDPNGFTFVDCIKLFGLPCNQKIGASDDKKEDKIGNVRERLSAF